MRIAQLTYIYHRVFPNSNQAIYSHVGWLTNGLVQDNNDVTLFASGDSETKAKLFSVNPTATSKDPSISEDERKNLTHHLISQCYQQAKKFDIIHSHFSLSSAFYSRLVSTPTVQSLHSPINPHNKKLLLDYKDNNYISFSLAQRRQMPELNWVANIYHGVDIGKFSFNPQPQDYVLYLGRITEEKGVHLAIEAAKAAGVQLIIAGRSYPSEGYWHEKIESHIDGKSVRYVGEADFPTKIEYLKNAKALLFPTQYDEVFGLVMIEALACGTPVIGWDNGSVGEVIKDRTTGFVVKSVKDTVKAIQSIDKINREDCRARAQNLFSVEKMVSGYEKVYVRIIEDYLKKHYNNNGPSQVTNL
jgi:glycosyltransferase involved in cell wall biosynthesis